LATCICRGVVVITRQNLSTFVTANAEMNDSVDPVSMMAFRNTSPI
jgi:hypothetical protein